MAKINDVNIIIINAGTFSEHTSLPTGSPGPVALFHLSQSFAASAAYAWRPSLRAPERHPPSMPHKPLLIQAECSLLEPFAVVTDALDQRGGKKS
ncbi:hypothetical protein DXG01_006749 [Tephrocybe rancida]|nr:hypothetical protein DXG01_006749 [Tephrocybe rancida]